MPAGVHARVRGACTLPRVRLRRTVDGMKTKTTIRKRPNARRAKLGEELKTERFVIHMTPATKLRIFAHAAKLRTPAAQWAERLLYDATVPK